MAKKEEEKNFWKDSWILIEKVGVIIAALSVIIPAAIYIGSTLAELKSERIINSLLIKVDSLQSLVTSDSLGKKKLDCVP